MKLLLLAIALLPLPALASHRCTGSAHCRVCKNCRYCHHCAVLGGSCSVKRAIARGYKPPVEWRRKHPRRAHS